MLEMCKFVMCLCVLWNKEIQVSPKPRTPLFSDPNFLVDGWIFSLRAKITWRRGYWSGNEFGSLWFIGHTFRGVICKLENFIYSDTYFFARIWLAGEVYVQGVPERAYQFSTGVPCPRNSVFTRCFYKATI